MPNFYNSKLLPFTNKQLYDIIIDVKAYPEFLPWCKKTEIISKVDSNNFDAVLTVGYKALDENYTSRVEGVYLREIRSSAIAGPFKYLDSVWTFKKYQKHCEVYFEINYEFKSFFLGKIMGSLFLRASEKMFEAFESRAKQLYL
tara:strand:- start:142 stop:573 length:432 start_codon:yes stop_codon:yes gene_type:complete